MKNIIEVAFEGNDGSGKTTTIGGVSRELWKNGIAHVVVAPFAEANKILQVKGVSDIYKYWISGDREKVIEGLGLLGEIVTKTRQDINNQLPEDGGGVVLYDRHWMTVLRSMEDVPSTVEIQGDSGIQEKLSFWLKNIPPTVFCEATPDVTRLSHKFHPDRGWNKTDAAMAQEYNSRLCLVKKYRDRILRINEYTGHFPMLNDFIKLTTSDIIDLLIKNERI